MGEKIILKNSVQCKRCEDILESKHRHDFVTCSCGAVYIDGGHAYFRRGGEFDLIIDLSLVAREEALSLANTLEPRGLSIFGAAARIDTLIDRFVNEEKEKHNSEQKKPSFLRRLIWWR